MADYNLQIEPTDKNIYECLRNNTLSNNDWINKCLSILLTMDNSIISFDAQWGNGKTFLAKQFQSIINEKWAISNNRKIDSEYDIIPELSFKDIPNNSYYAIYYNAWEYDDDNDPIASFMYYLLKKLNKEIKSDKIKEALTNFVKNVLEKISQGWIKFGEKGEDNKLEKVLSSVIETKNIREEIKKLLDELKAEKFNNLVIFIDELDRCRPTYAVKIIEMIKHYLKMENILIICMTDMKQLVNCISSVYGSKYDSNMYLDKIFDYKFTIPIFKYDKNKYVNMKLNKIIDNSYFFDRTCIELINHLNLTLRNIDKFLGYVGKMFETNKIISRDNSMIRAFIEHLFIPYYVGVMLFDQSKFDNLMKNKLEDYIIFCKREGIMECVKEIYSVSLCNEYDETKLFEYIEHDSQILVRKIKGEKNIRERCYICNGSMGSIDRYIKNIDLLDFFVRNTIDQQV